jgi:tetratricopeptide (TPR) repeat protein
LNIIEQKARSENQPADWLLLGKIYQDRGDADSALDAYNRGVLVDPKDFTLAKEYGLYLEQAGQKQKAAYTLRKAYTLNQNDEQVNSALARLNVVPGPGLKDEAQLVRPPVPEGPLPEVDLSKFKFGGSNSSEPESTAQPSAPSPTLAPPPAPRASTPVPGQRAVSTPRD